MKTATSYVIVAKSKRVLLECSTRKKARRQARKHHRDDYMHKSTVIIVTGDDLKDALEAYKLAIQKQAPEKRKISERKTDKKAAQSKKKTKAAKVSKKTKKANKKKALKKASKKAPTMLDDLFTDEDKELKRINRKRK